ncbi:MULTISPECIES: GFA family protein [unclassified Lysobacter]|uniref:GFA family protein n=1 Tax=unclassified Lysobacter TaxID=2635362 RepID=UPI001BE9BB0F|nr:MULTISPECIES: GFA family protein [unclassified Lysobacter]MBT2748752.1 GFA family protein [Lysobacter sp. ISL-42]MBT2751687.1 GFA family protein [Lysobacter sp. ISL-50]MBT2775881.1 GFA family protein [Lysobacter sp. ISL-54]MBT2782155.1 GFA family protein [Lysobacter sp. ISL-52]
MDPIEVACNCGAVTARLDAQPLQQFYCHCDDCQRASGSPYVAIALFPAASVRVHGETVAWTLRTLPRHRCPVCGIQIFGEVPGGEIIGIRAERLPPDLFQPAFHIHCRYARLPVQDALPHYAGLPPLFGGNDERVAW